MDFVIDGEQSLIGTAILTRSGTNKKQRRLMEQHEEGVRVERTELGLGVFAVREFLPHEAIGPIRGRIVRDPYHESDYCMELDDEHGLEPAAPYRYINHSCHPNSQLVHIESEFEDGSPSTTELWVEVLREIEPGQQVTIDYGWPAEAAIPCLCGSSNCRGWIVAEEEMHYLHDEHGTSPADYNLRLASPINVEASSRQTNASS